MEVLNSRKPLFLNLVIIIITTVMGTSTSSSLSVPRPQGGGGSLDYVSLTDQSSSDHRTGYHHQIQEDEVNATVWAVGVGGGGGGSHLCDTLPRGCECKEGLKSKSLIHVRCRCEDINKVVNLKRGTHPLSQDLLPDSSSIRWEVGGCSKVVVHTNLLSSFFNRSLNLHVKFTNIPNLILHEGSFAMKDSSSIHPTTTTTVEFNDCQIPTLPPKSFPSSLSLLKFVDSRIGKIEEKFISSLKMNKVGFHNCIIDEVKMDAFYRETLMDTLESRDSTFRHIHEYGVASAMQLLNWTGTRVDILESQGLSGQIANVTMRNCSLNNVRPQGFAVTKWSEIDLRDNKFENVAFHGITLLPGERDASESVPPTLRLLGNSWGEGLLKDFIRGVEEDHSPKILVEVENNTFLQNCSCESKLDANFNQNQNPSSFFRKKFLEGSRCPLTQRQRGCIESVNGTSPQYLPFSDYPELCDSDRVFMCTSDVTEMHINPKLPNRLEVLAFFIGAFVLFMVISLLITLLVYMIKSNRKRRRKGGGGEGGFRDEEEFPRKDFVKSLNPHHNTHLNHHPDPYFNTSTSSQSRVSKTPSIPTRMALLEDVEMEDKGVQTLPTELSADILEGLKEKLSRPDTAAFWDAKETIDQLYDLIHVKDQSSPPDVTCNKNNETGELRSPRHSALVSSGSSSPSKRPSLLSSPTKHLSTFAQSPMKRGIINGKSVASVGVGSGDPIYSELQGVSSPSKLRNSSFLPSPSTPPPPLPSTAPPMLCEYTEPRDYQAHIYAELLCTEQGDKDKNNISTASTVIPSSSSSPPTRPHSINLNDLNMKTNNGNNGTTHSSTTSNNTTPTHNNPSKSNVITPQDSPRKRPLPQIPAKPIRKS